MHYDLVHKRVFAPIFITLCGLLPLGSVGAAAAETSSLAASAPAATLAAGLAEARKLAMAGDIAAAFSAYVALLREYPEDVTVNLELGRVAHKAGHNNHALLAYERVLGLAPNVASVRLEYAYLLRAMGRAEQAAEQLAAAKQLDPTLATDKLSQAVTNLERHLATLTTRGRVAAGLIYDSNMTMAPSNSHVQLGNFDIILEPQSREKDSLGSYLHATGEAAWRSSPDSPWWLVGDLGAYQRWYTESNPNRDLSYGRAAAGLRYTRDSVLAEVRLKSEMMLEHNKHSVSLYGTEFTLARAMTPTWHLIGRVGIDHRDDQRVKGRNGTYSFAALYSRLFFGEAGHSALLGLRGYTASTEVKRHEFTGFEPSANLNLKLPWRTELQFGLSWHAEKYRGPATVMEFHDRRDRQWRASVGAVKKLNDKLQLEAAWEYRDNHSNSDLYQYDQNMVVVGLAYTF
ncbi:hypothetical protein AGMMS49960_07770 [Betaproteobacteria bacterium]|nr:hypothetical protein AGMMS49543_06210 [Betaproteobacteria bacterium]GHU00224.1 hypothetical protein AGMMS49960_07770 [Betaproteobacteria bacterium]GHU23637.1 hypothetical protein AGMMS50243_25410 [Betaproteobacteria bacterium]